MEPPTISGTNLRTAFVLLLVAAVTALFLAVAWPFLKPLLLGALLAGLFHPLYRWITRVLGGRPSLGAAVTLLVLLVLGLGPVSAFLGIVVQQALTVSDQAIPWLSQHLGAASTYNVHEWLVRRFPALAEYMPKPGATAATGRHRCQNGRRISCQFRREHDRHDSHLPPQFICDAVRDVFLFQRRPHNLGTDFLLHSAE